MRKKVIIVEDNFIIQMFLEEIISGMGHDILACTDNGNEVIELCRRESPDVILLDIGLSGDQNGIEIAATIKKNHRVPFVFLTGNSDKATLDQAWKQGPLHIINKPIDEDKLKYEFAVVIEKLDREEEYS